MHGVLTDPDDTLAAEPRTPAPTFTPGTIVADRYVVERELGRGAAGAVYAARDQELGELVALEAWTGLSCGNAIAFGSRSANS